MEKAWAGQYIKGEQGQCAGRVFVMHLYSDLSETGYPINQFIDFTGSTRDSDHLPLSSKADHRSITSIE